MSENCALQSVPDGRFLTMNIVPYMSRFALATNHGVRTLTQRLQMETLSSAISHEIIRLRNAGTLDDLYKKWFLSGARCNEAEEDGDGGLGGESDAPPSFDIDNMAGIFLIHIAAGCVALILWIVYIATGKIVDRAMLHHHQQKKKRELEKREKEEMIKSALKNTLVAGALPGVQQGYVDNQSSNLVTSRHSRGGSRSINKEATVD